MNTFWSGFEKRAGAISKAMEGMGPKYRSHMAKQLVAGRKDLRSNKGFTELARSSSGKKTVVTEFMRRGLPVSVSEGAKHSSPKIEHLRKNAGEISRGMKAMGFSDEGRRNFAKQLRGERALSRMKNPSDEAFKKNPPLGVFEGKRWASGKIPPKGNQFEVHLRDATSQKQLKGPGKKLPPTTKKSKFPTKRLGAAALAIPLAAYLGNRWHKKHEKSST